MHLGVRDVDGVYMLTVVVCCGDPDIVDGG